MSHAANPSEVLDIAALAREFFPHLPASYGQALVFELIQLHFKKHPQQEPKSES